MSALVLESVSRSFGGVRAVDEISLNAPAGRITGLIGPNGAGKSTVVNLITGFLKVSRGRVLVNGHDLTQAEAPQLARAGVARTFQNIRLVGDATALDNVIAGLHCHEQVGIVANLLGLPSAWKEKRRLEAAALALLDRFGMAAYAQYPAGGLSYGHQRRVEIMRALALEPSVLLLDEPVAGMNDNEAFELGEIFEAVAAQGVAILLIEHNMRFVMSLCQYIYVVSSGRLIAEGTADTVMRDAGVISAYLGS